MFKVGLTGGMGTGKSEVAGRLRELGAHVIEADEIGRGLLDPGSPVSDQLVEAFGEGILGDDGSIDRRELAGVAFSSDEALRTLNEITWPELLREIGRRSEEIAEEDPEGVLVVDAALLVEWNILEAFDVVLVVSAPQDLRVERLVKSGFELSDVVARMRSQLPDEVVEDAADVVIENDGTLLELQAAVDAFWDSLPTNDEEDEE